MTRNKPFLRICSFCLPNYVYECWLWCRYH